MKNWHSLERDFSFMKANEKRSQNHVKWICFDRGKGVKVAPDRSIHLDRMEDEPYLRQVDRSSTRSDKSLVTVGQVDRQTKRTTYITQ